MPTGLKRRLARAESQAIATKDRRSIEYDARVLYNIPIVELWELYVYFWLTLLQLELPTEVQDKFHRPPYDATDKRWRECLETASNPSEQIIKWEEPPLSDIVVELYTELEKAAKRKFADAFEIRSYFEENGWAFLRYHYLSYWEKRELGLLEG